MKKLIHSFTARKILELLLTLLIVTFLSFLLVKLSPVDAAEAYARRTFMLYSLSSISFSPGSAAASASIMPSGRVMRPLA